MKIPEEAFDAATKRVTAETLGAEWSRTIARLAVEAAAPIITAEAIRMTTDKQQTYHAAPDHPLWDILDIHARGYAVPWDGDKWARYYKTKETK